MFKRIKAEIQGIAITALYLGLPYHAITMGAGWTLPLFYIISVVIGVMLIAAAFMFVEAKDDVIRLKRRVSNYDIGLVVANYSGDISKVQNAYRGLGSIEKTNIFIFLARAIVICTLASYFYWPFMILVKYELVIIMTIHVFGVVVAQMMKEFMAEAKPFMTQVEEYEFNLAPENGTPTTGMAFGGTTQAPTPRRTGNRAAGVDNRTEDETADYLGRIGLG